MSALPKLSALAASAALSLAAASALAQAPAAPAPPISMDMLRMLATAQAAQPAAPQAAEEPACNASAIASWMPKGQSIDWNSLPTTQIDAGLVHPVKADLGDATARLATVEAAALSLADAARFTGVAPAKLKPARAALTPYLVRSVYPVPESTVRVTWYGDYLEVFGIGEGCAPFTNTPVVVFLDRAPKQVVAMVANGHGSGN
jgi:hypothetical protein